MAKVIGAVAKVVFAIFAISVLGLLMSLTYGALQILFPNSFANQIWGLIMFDIAALCWAITFAFLCESVTQYAAAAIGFCVAFLGTLLMVAADVILGGQTYVQSTDIGKWMVYGFIIVTAIHSALVYMHHAGAPEIHSRINLGIAKGEITMTAIQQATTELDVHKAALAASIRDELIASVKRELGLPIGQTALPIIDVPEDQIRFTPAPKPPYQKDKADQPQTPLPQSGS